MPKLCVSQACLVLCSSFRTQVIFPLRFRGLRICQASCLIWFICSLPWQLFGIHRPSLSTVAYPWFHVGGKQLVKNNYWFAAVFLQFLPCFKNRISAFIIFIWKFVKAKYAEQTFFASFSRSFWIGFYLIPYPKLGLAFPPVSLLLLSGSVWAF